MEMLAVTSSNISGVGYDGKDLYVEYHNGRTYVYKDVPKNIYDAFLAADSKGRFMSANIKGHYKYDWHE